jgi:hypothetical protein
MMFSYFRKCFAGDQGAPVVPERRFGQVYGVEDIQAMQPEAMSEKHCDGHQSMVARSAATCVNVFLDRCKIMS